MSKNEPVRLVIARGGTVATVARAPPPFNETELSQSVIGFEDSSEGVPS